MPIHDLGYRAWQGPTVPEATRWWVITQTGLRLAWKNPWLRRAVLVAWLPALAAGGFIFGYEQLLTDLEKQPINSAVDPYRMVVSFARGTMVGNILETLPESEDVFAALSARDIPEARHSGWAWLVMNFFRYPQAVLLALVVGLVAPPLIAQDVRSRAFLLYFSRPITRLEYIVGKLAVVWGYVLMITTVPALALYVLGVLLSPELAVVGYTWDLPLRILVASAVLIVPTTTMALAFSAATGESRYAGAGWFAVWAVGYVSYYLLRANLPGEFGNDNWTIVSLYHVLGKVQTWVFGLGGGFVEVVPSAVLLTGITVVSVIVLFRRVSAPMRQ